MGRQWNQIIESLGPLTGGTVSINANLGDIDALLTTIQADIADGIPLNPNLDYIKLNGSLGGPNDVFTLGWYARRDTTQDRKWTIVDKFTVYFDTGIWKLYCLDVDNDGLVASVDVSDQGDIRQYLPPRTGWTFEAGWSGTFSVSLIQPSVENAPFNLSDGSGNAITSSSIGGKQRLDVNLSSAGTTGSAVPTTANLYAGTDGTNLRAVSVDTNGRVNINQVRGTTTIGTLTATTSNGTLFATNSTRNYLLVQCTSGTAYLDTNGTATTANGILLTSGQGITFEGSFIPTGAIAAITSTGTSQLIGRQG